MYWNPDQIPTPPRDEEGDGYFYPFEQLVVPGEDEWAKTGRIPHPKELEARLIARWVRDLVRWRNLKEAGRPKEPPKPESI